MSGAFAKTSISVSQRDFSCESDVSWLGNYSVPSMFMADGAVLSKQFVAKGFEPDRDFSISEVVGAPRAEAILRNETSLSQYETIKQKWAGVITDFNDEEIFAILRDLTDSSNPKEEVVLFREELDPADQVLVEKGAEFFWHIGYREGVNSPRERFSKIRLRRFPKWTKAELDSSAAFAEKYAALFSASN